MALKLAVIIDSTGLTNIFDLQGVKYGIIPDKGFQVMVEDNHPEIGKKIWVPKDGIIQVEELEAALAAGVPVTPPLAKPAKPGTITESGVTKTEIKLDWDQVADAASYNVAVTPAVTGYPKDISVNTDTITGLTAATGYTIKIKACNASGCSVQTQKTVTTAA